MLEENEKCKRMQLMEKEQERLNDIKAQEEYTRMLDKQEKDREQAVKGREKRTQEFMGHMADTVIKDLDRKMQEEEAKMKYYEAQRELRERHREEERLRK